MKQSLESSFLQCYDEHADAIFRFCLFRVYDREKAKELMQDAFMKTWKALAAGKKIKNMRAFVYKTTKRLIIDYHRKKKELSLESLQENGYEPASDPESQWQAMLDGKQLLEKANELEDPYKEVFYLRYIDQLTPKEISLICKESTNVISVRINRAKKQFLLLIEDLV